MHPPSRALLFLSCSYHDLHPRRLTTRRTCKLRDYRIRKTCRAPPRIIFRPYICLPSISSSLPFSPIWPAELTYPSKNLLVYFSFYPQ
ncbi:hypothetical protein BDN70DRAFT_689548 [Pholiota conissans]|uniref:Uncharacterized protein n=1 Tax=Pholiota conissans TaxID=109636 RepID=A0A9P5YIK0_9AGAR|nr:hypothetical protein BDN70DRAFT_689548 [Pholiota conissans]